MAVAGSNLTKGSDTVSASTFATASVAPGANRLQLMSVYAVDGAFTTPPLINLSSSGLTWVSIHRAIGAFSSWQVFRALGASPGSGAITIGSDQATMFFANWIADEFTGVDTSGTNGSGAIGNIADNAAASVSTLAVTLAAFGSANNGTYGAFNADVGSGAMSFTPGTGFSELAEQVDDLGFLVFGMETEWKATNDTGVDVTTAITVDSLNGFAAEIVAASPDVSVNLSGQSITALRGTVAPTNARVLTGQSATASQTAPAKSSSHLLTGSAATSSAGTLAPAHANVLTGQNITAAQGSLIRTITEALTGLSMTVSAGSVALSHTNPVSGQSAATSAGTLAAAKSVALSGQSMTATPGSVVAAIAKALTGQGIAIQQGFVNAGGNVTVGLTGQSMTASAGTLAYSVALQLVGSALTASQGSITATSGGNVTVTLTGQAISAALGTVGASRAIALLGQSATAAAGTLSAAHASALTGQSTTLSAGTLALVRALELLGIPFAISQGTLTPQQGTNVTVNLTGLVMALTGGNLSPAITAMLEGAGISVSTGSVYALTPPAGGSAAPYPSVEGQVASPNPLTVVPNPEPATTVAGPNGCIIGRFGRMDEAGEVWNGRRSASDTLGFVLAVSSNWGSVYWTSGRPVLRAYLPITLMAGGDFWCRFSAGAVPGARVYARLVDGAAVSGYAADCEPTPWYVVTQAAAGELAVISTTSRVQ